MISPETEPLAAGPLREAVRPGAIELRGVSKIYKLYDSPRSQLFDQIGLYRLAFWCEPRRFHEFHALRDVSLRVEKGERVGIVGRNGAGKTTLLKLVTGNFLPTRGTVRVNGSLQALMQLGMGIHPEFSGYENIKGALTYNGLVGREFEKALHDVVDFVELGEFLHQPMKTYSLGMNARVQFAAATAIRPDVLIIDEILGAGDGYFAAKSAHRMQQLTSSGCTLLLVSHSTAQILQFCESAVWIEEGSIRMCGPALEVVKSYEEFLAELVQLDPALARGTPLPAPFPSGQGDYATPQWQMEQLSKLLGSAAVEVRSSQVSERISRWPAETGLKIVRVEVLDEHDRPSTMVKSGRPMAIETEIIAEQGGEFSFQVVFLIMTLEGVGVVRHLSHPFHHPMSMGERTLVRLSYDKLLLAQGEFVFSAALYKRYDPDDSSTAVRYDLLSRSFRLKVLPMNRSEPAVFNHPCCWEIRSADAKVG